MAHSGQIVAAGVVVAVVVVVVVAVIVVVVAVAAVTAAVVAVAVPQLQMYQHEDQLLNLLHQKSVDLLRQDGVTRHVNSRSSQLPNATAHVHTVGLHESVLQMSPEDHFYFVLADCGCTQGQVLPMRGSSSQWLIFG